MYSLIKLSIAIKLSKLRNANDFLTSPTSPKANLKILESSSTDTSPTAEEQSEHERGVSFGGEIDFSQEPSTEYLN